MDSKTVSVQAILDGIDYLKVNFVAKLDEQTEQAIQSYTSLKQGVLSSATIDSIIGEIKGKVTQLQNSYNEVADTIRKELSTSEGIISQSNKSILDTLNNGR